MASGAIRRATTSIGVGVGGALTGVPIDRSPVAAAGTASPSADGGPAVALSTTCRATTRPGPPNAALAAPSPLGAASVSEAAERASSSGSWCRAVIAAANPLNGDSSAVLTGLDDATRRWIMGGYSASAPGPFSEVGLSAAIVPSVTAGTG